MSGVRRHANAPDDASIAHSEGAPESAAADEASFSCSEEAARLLEAKQDTAAKQRKRERAALAVFGVLVLAGFVVLTSYIANASNGLNVAATSIDDIAGDMSGYDVLLFKGTVQPDETDASSSASASKTASKSSASTTSAGESSPSEAFELQEESSLKEEVVSLLFGDEAAAAVQDADDTESSSASDEALSDDADASSDERSEADDPLVSADSSSAADAKDVITVDEAREIYEGKQASVIEIDPASLRDYASGRIIMKDGHTYGIFSLTPDMAGAFQMPKTTTTQTTTTTTESSAGVPGVARETTKTHVTNTYKSVSELFAAIDPDTVDEDLVEHIEGILERFEAAHVDTVVAFTSDPTPFSTIDGVDVVITFKTEDRFSMSEVIDGTLYFDAPEVGEVGVLMIAPGNVASTKVLSAD